MPDSLIESIPAEEIDKPKRRGRPPKLDPATGERVNAPRQSGKRRAKRGGTPRTVRAPKSLYPEIAGSLSAANALFSMTPLGSKYEPTGRVNMIQFDGIPAPIPLPELKMIALGDELDDAEIMHLAKALDAQCQRSVRFRKAVERFLGVAAGGGIIGIVGMIAARRASRHGIVDRSLDPKLGAMLADEKFNLASLAAFAPAPDPDAVNAETGEQAPMPTGEPVDVDEESFDYEAVS